LIEANSHRDSRLSKHRPARQQHHRQQFRFHNLSCLSASDNAGQGPNPKCNEALAIALLQAFSRGSAPPPWLF
jgi:hypothetical protein